MKVSAKSVLLELLAAGPSIYHDSLPVRQLVKAASVFDIAENSVRVAIVRLRADGLLDSPTRGHYCLGPAAKGVTNQIRSWQRIPDRIGTWDESWVAVFTADLSRTDRPALRRRLQALRLLGFAELRPGLHVRPNNLSIGLDSMRDELTDLGLEFSAPLFVVSKFTDEELTTIKSLWDTDTMNGVYRDLRDQLETSEARLDELPLHEAVREAFLFEREAVRWLVLDPLLPAPLVRHEDRDALLATAFGYNDKALALWAKFIAEDQ